eukprot:gb/GECH01013082.1/.p1 GENE.gb/GECH01013082.1/~~gb/GECH01013082.1/.p1  ORF type:complete len:116 (+),score=11.03 gb/GECH01013082.1/:1-348(+)
MTTHLAQVDRGQFDTEYPEILDEVMDRQEFLDIMNQINDWYFSSYIVNGRTKILIFLASFINFILGIISLIVVIVVNQVLDASLLLLFIPGGLIFVHVNIIFLIYFTLAWKKRMC